VTEPFTVAFTCMTPSRNAIGGVWGAALGAQALSAATTPRWRRASCPRGNVFQRDAAAKAAA
jgi:hypothetical protein